MNKKNECEAAIALYISFAAFYNPTTKGAVADVSLLGDVSHLFHDPSCKTTGTSVSTFKFLDKTTLCLCRQFQLGFFCNWSPGFSRKPHRWPNDVIPTNSILFKLSRWRFLGRVANNAPPLSPWQASFPTNTHFGKDLQIKKINI